MIVNSDCSNVLSQILVSEREEYPYKAHPLSMGGPYLQVPDSLFVAL